MAKILRLWEKLGKTGQRITLILTIVSALGLTGRYIGKIVSITQEFAYLPELVRLNNLRINNRIDSLAHEQSISWKIDSSLHYDMILTENSVEGLWSIMMANTKAYNGRDYQMTLVGEDIGSAVDVFLREDNNRPPQVWAFWKVCGMSAELQGHCHYYCLQANWSIGYNRFYIIDFSGEEIIIYEKN